MTSVHSRLTVLASILAVALAPAFFAKRPMQAQLSNQGGFICSGCVEREGRFYCGTCEQSTQQERDGEILQHDEWVEEVVCNPADQARCAEQGKYCQVIANRKECIWGRGNVEPQETPIDNTQSQDEESDRVREARAYCEEMGLSFELVDNIPFCTGEPSADGAGDAGSIEGSAGIWNPSACSREESLRCAAENALCRKINGRAECIKSGCSVEKTRECAITDRECVVTAGGEICRDTIRAMTTGGTPPVASCTPEMIERCRSLGDGWECVEAAEGRPHCAQIGNGMENGDPFGLPPNTDASGDNSQNTMGGGFEIAAPLPPEPLPQEPEPIPAPEPVAEDPLTRSIWTFFCGLSGRSYNGANGCQ